MLKKRIIAVLLVKGGLVVQSRRFGNYLPVGKPEIQAEFLDDWGIDEIILLHIDSPESIDLRLVSRVAKKCLVPLTVGGGLRCLDQADQLFQSGADKVFVNTALFHNPELVNQIANKYGNQSVVVGLDFLEDGRLYHPGNREPSLLHLESQIQKAQSFGAGEILLQSVDRDGVYQGYDLATINRVEKNISVPLIALGGVGSPAHVEALFRTTSAAAAAVGNMLHFTEHSVILMKQQLLRHGLEVRLETHASYAESALGDDGRLARKSDAALEKLLYIRTKREVI